MILLAEIIGLHPGLIEISVNKIRIRCCLLTIENSLKSAFPASTFHYERVRKSLAFLFPRLKSAHLPDHS